MSDSHKEFHPLILTICSYHKQEGGKKKYSDQSSVFSSLSPKNASSLKEHRKEIFHLLRSGNIYWAQQNENDNEFNASLISGPDIGGESDEGSYLPAVERYSGEDSRFYSKLGQTGIQNLTDNRVKTLILSGLYGMVTPKEQVQCYSIPVEWNSNIQKIWQKDNLLTNILIEFLEYHRITHIFDFMLREDYRDLLNWHRIQETYPVRVRHCFSRKGAGNDALSDAGKFFRDIPPMSLLQALKDIPIDKNPNYSKSHVIYARTVPKEWDGFPAERKRIPTSYGLLFYETIPDSETRQIFESAEKIMKILYNAEDVGKDPGSVFFMYYGKGLEVLLHNTISKKIVKRIRKKYPDETSRHYSSLPDTLHDILNDKTISLGGWGYIQKDWVGNNPIVSLARDFFGKNFQVYYSDIVRACNLTLKYRNPADHQKISTMEEFLSVRKSIIQDINTCIFDLCGEEVRMRHFRQVLRTGTEEEMKEAISYLEKQRDYLSAPRITRLLHEGDPSVRLKCIKALGILGDSSNIRGLERFATDGTPQEKQSALEAIQSIQSRLGDQRKED